MVEDIRKFKTKRDIQQALVMLLHTKSFYELTVVDICQAALISRSTFYDHYDDKYDLLEQMVTKYTRIFQDNIQKRFPNFLTDDDYQITLELNHGLENDKDAILSLLSVHQPKADLEANLKAVFADEWHQYFKTSQINSALPADFMLFLETDVVVSLFKWSLMHEMSPEIAAFASEFRKLLVGLSNND